MSTGDWFTLRPLNFVSRQELDNDINNIMTRLTRLEDDNTYIMNILDQTWDMITQINLSIMNLTNRVGSLEGNVANINTQLQELQGLPARINDLETCLTDLNNRVDPLFGRLDNLEAYYMEINHYNLLNVPFHQPLYTVYANVLDISWYRPIRLLDGGGSDLRYLIMVVRGFSINLGENITRYWSDQIDLPIPRLNSNDFEVQYALNSPMRTRQAEYDFEFNPISKFRIGV
jgi:hypothetical protein